MIDDCPKNWKDFCTDPGFVSVIGFGFLFAGLAICLLNKELIAAYNYYAMGIVGVVGGHAWTDSKKVQYMSKDENSKDPAPEEKEDK